MPTTRETKPQHTPGPCSKARVIEGGVLVPTSGVVQSANLLSLITAAPEMLEALVAADQLAVYIEATLASVSVPSGQPDVSRAFTDIRRALLACVAERRAAIRAATEG